MTAAAATTATSPPFRTIFDTRIGGLRGSYDFRQQGLVLQLVEIA
jgi:hypothetical protein